AVVAFEFLGGGRAEHVELGTPRPSALEPATKAAELETPAEKVVANEADHRVEVEGARVLVHVVDPAGLAVAGAQLALFRGESLLHIATSDAAGSASFETSTEPAEYALFAHGWALMRGTIELTPGERTLSLVEGAVVAGSVLVDETIPAVPLELKFHLDDRTTGEPMLPKAVQVAVRAARGGNSGSLVRTRPDGTFEIRGLPAPCAGSLQWSGPYFLSDAQGRSRGNRITVAGPRRDLLLLLVSGFELRLRVVDAAGTPVAGAPVLLNQGLRTEERRTSKASSTADSEGRFVRDFLLAPDTAMEVVVALVGGAAAKEYVVHLPVDGRGILDLGDLATESAQDVNVLVLDDAQAPLAGARVAPLPWHFQPETLTDDAGRVQLRLGGKDRRLGVTAPGFLGNSVEVPSGATEIVARMARASILELFVAGASDAKHGLQLSLEGPNPLFVGQDGEGPSTPQSAGSSSMTVHETTSMYEPSPGKDGRWKIAGLTPGQSLRAALSGSDGRALCAVDIAPLTSGEQRVVELRPDAKSRALRVRVLGPDRAVLPKATIRIAEATSLGQTPSSAVDAQGEVELASVFADPCGIEARAPGFPSKVVVVRGTPTETVEILLEKPRSVEVELVSHDGQPLGEPIFVHAGRGGSTERGTPLGAQRFRIDNLPTGEVLLSAFGQGGMASRLHDTREPYAKLTV
ncbi:MAG TPA: carboxypeptidase-like regulatory domain-containing protein, partial [Planctomycetota bacterium]|nr:carboxypeptidase-like regulatory domain-containing protein [Planctomycetota bacterium]